MQYLIAAIKILKDTGGWSGHAAADSSGEPLPDTPEVEAARIKLCLGIQNLDRKLATELLQAETGGAVGIYLVRTKPSGMVVLSVIISPGKISHYEIKYSKSTGKYTSKSGDTFDTVPELVEYFKNTKSDGVPCHLLHCIRAYDSELELES